eukprot:1144301-Pelagomonas_calceolata.AAC.2
MSPNGQDPELLNKVAKDLKVHADRGSELAQDVEKSNEQAEMKQGIRQQRGLRRSALNLTHQHHQEQGLRKEKRTA